MLITVKIAGAVLISDIKDRVNWFVNTELGSVHTRPEKFRNAALHELFVNVPQTKRI